MAKFIFTTDVHGNLDFFKEVLDRAKKKDIKAAIFGGDICPLAPMDRQRTFLQYSLIPLFQKYKRYKKDIFIMMGNDDFAVNMDLLERAEKDGILKLLHMRAHKAGTDFMAGYTCINETPFMIKDWERREEEIAGDLKELAKKSDPKKTIYVFHAPPFGTNLDVIHSGVHVGSKAIREFIEKKQPPVTLHGHIHESADMTGSFFDKIGKTVCINPGRRAIIFDPNKGIV